MHVADLGFAQKRFVSENFAIQNSRRPFHIQIVRRVGNQSHSGIITTETLPNQSAESFRRLELKN